MAEEYKVELGIGLNDKQLNSVKTTINNLVDKERKINLDIDFNIKNAQVLANAGKEIENLKLKLDELGDINLAKKGKSAIPINTESVEKSIKNINESIKKLQNAFGRVDKNRGVQSLLTTVSKISVELTNVSKQFGELNKNLSSLSSKDFSINFGFDLGSNKKDPEQLMKELRVLEKEAREYENYFYKTLNKTNKFDEKNARSSIYQLANKVGKSDSKNYLLTLDKAMASESDVTKVAAYKQYIKTIKELAEIGGYSIASVEARLADSTGFTKLQNEANETEEKLKRLFSGGIDATKLHKSLEDIATSLKEIQRSVSELSSSFSANGLTESFNKLSASLKEVFDNCTLVKQNLDNIGNVGASSGQNTGVENLKQDLKQVEVAAQKASDAVRETVNESKKLNNISVDISDGGIDELKNSLRSIGADEDIIERITNEITNMGIVAKNVSGTLKEGDLVKFDVQGIQKTEDGLERIITLTKTLNDGNWLNSESYTQSINNDFEELKRRAKEISNLRINILNSDDVSDINRMSAELDRLNKEFDELYTNAKSGLSGRQIFQIDNLVNQGDTKTVNAFNKELNEFVKLQNQIENTRFEIGKLEVVDGKDNEIAELKRQLEELEDTYNRLMNTFMKKATANGDIIKLDDFKNLENGITTATVNAENRLERFKSQYADTRAELARKIKVDIELGNFDDDVSKMQDKLDKLSHASKDLYISVGEVKDALNRMDEASKPNNEGVFDVERLIKAQQDYARAIEKTNNLIDQQTRKEAAEARSQKLIDDRQIFQSKIDSWLTKNSAAAKDFGAKMLDLKAKAENCDRVTLNHLQKQFTKLDNAADKAGLKMMSFKDRIGTKLKEYSAYFSVAEVFMYITQGLKDMFEQVKLIDSAMTELKKVTDETDAAYSQFLSNAADKAKEIGTTIDRLVSSTADFARLGYGFRESQGLAEVANIYAVVGDDIDNVESATQSLISTLTAFKNEANGLSNDDFALSIVDKMNEVSNNFAISSGGIGDALQRSASSMMAANNSLDETIALITAANTVVQDPDAVGTAFKTISMRIRGAKTELEEAGLETEGMVESTAKLRSEIKALTGVDIMDGANQFKSTYQIMDELADKWQNLSDIQQATVTELIAGKRQGNIVSSLMNNFDIAENALNTSLNSSGSAMKEHEKYMDSIEAKLSQLKASWQGFAQTFMDSNFLKGGIDALSGFVDILEKLVDKFGVLGTIGFGSAIFGLFKNRNNFSGILSSLSAFGQLASEAWHSSGKLTTRFKDIGKAAGMAGGDIVKSLTGSLSGMIGVIGLVTAAIGLFYNNYKKAKEEAAAHRQEVIESSDAYLDAASSFEKAYIKYSDKTDLTASEEEELKTAIQGTVDALGDKSGAIQGAINSNNDYLASLEAIKKAELDAARRAAEDKRDNAEESLKEAAIGYESWDGSSVDINLGKTENEATKIIKEIGEKYHFQETKGNYGAQYHHYLTLNPNADVNEILDYYYTLLDVQEELKNQKLDNTDEYEKVTSAIDKMSDSISVYTDGVYEAVKANYQLSQGIPKTAEEYVKMRESILRDKELDGFSFDKKMSIANTLDSEYSQLFDLSSAEIQARKFVGLIKGYGDGIKDGTDEIGQVETFLNMRTAVNNNECTVREYLSEFDKINSMTSTWNDEEKEIFNTTFGIDTDAIKKKYDDVRNYLSRNYKTHALGKSSAITGLHVFEQQEYINYEAEKFEEMLNNLTARELDAVVNIKTDIDWENTSLEEIRSMIKEEARFLEAMDYTIAIDVETESVEALNTAMAESVSGAGLSSEAIAALKGRYAELASDGYDLSSMFEETSNGIHLNREAVSEFEQTLASRKLKETDENLGVLKDRYDELTDKIETCTDAGERASLYSEQQDIARKINDLATLASQYEGLASAYNAWQNVESAGSERDMYESIIEGFETVGDEIKRGWYDDGTIKFLELITGETDLAGKSASELKEIWNGLDDTIKGTSYSVKDFFTTDDDGNSTSTGAYNFLRAIEELEKNGTLKALKGKNIEDLIVRNDKGKIVEFDFSVVGGDEAIADALGISEELVQIIQRTLDDAGFVVTLDGKFTLLADLKTSAEEANDTLKKLKSEGLKNLKNVDLNFDFNVDTVEGYQEQLEKALNVLDTFRDKNGKLKTDANGNLVNGAKQALEIAEYYTAAMDKLTEPKFMQIDTSVVDEELQEPIEKMQEIGDLCKEKHLLSLTGDTKELDKVQGEIDKVAKDIEKLDPEVKAQIGIDEDWDAKTIADKIEKGEIEIPAELKLDVQMSEDLKDIKLLMLQQLGHVTDEEVKLKVGYEIDDSTVDKLIKDGKAKIVLEFIEKNNEWFDKLSEKKQEIVIDVVASGVDLDILDDKEKKFVIDFIIKNEKEFNELSNEEKEVFVKFVGENQEWADKLSGEKKDILINLVASGIDLETLNKNKEVIIEFVAKNEEWFDKLSEEEKEVVVKLVADDTPLDEWENKEVEAIVKYMVDGGEVEDWTPEEKRAFAKYLVDGGEVEGWSPEAKDAFVKYLVDGGDPDKFDPDDKESWVVYKKDSTEPDNYDADDEEATVTYNKDSSVPDSYDPDDPSATVTFKKDTSDIDTYDPPDFVRTITYKIKQAVTTGASAGKKALQNRGMLLSKVNGTANVNGTIGKAFKQGDWRTKQTQTALTGELGREIVVTPQNRWYTVGDNGAEFVNIPRGSIVFNHKQTEELLRNGKATSDGGRAKALVNGTAYAQGTAFGSGSGGGEEAEVTSKNADSSSTENKFEDTIDWIEIILDRAERAIDKYEQQSNNVYKTWAKRNKALENEINQVSSTISLYEKAKNQYLSEANSVGLSESYARKVRNGSLSVEDFNGESDEKLVKKIKNYQDLYDKYLNCVDKINELKEQEASLYSQRFDNVQSEYDNLLQGFDHTESMLNEYISQAEEKGYIVSKNYYGALIDNEEDRIITLKQEQSALIKARDEAVANGEFDKYSEEW